jgi:hypothetical protein
MGAHRHLSDDALVEAIYGVRDIQPEVAECTDCAGRWQQAQAVRTQAVQPVDVSAEFLAAQRRRIYQRIDQPQPWHRSVLKWAPGLAAAGLMIAGFLTYSPGSGTSPTEKASVAETQEISDSQLFSELYSLEQSVEPSAAAPIRAMFEDSSAVQ